MFSNLRLLLQFQVRTFVIASFFGACIFGTTAAHAAATFTPLGLLGGAGSEAYDVSADGSAVAGFVVDALGNRIGVFRWTAAGSVVRSGQFNPLEPPAISADGNVIVVNSFRWSVGGSFESLDLRAGRDVSADGSVVAGYVVRGFTTEAVRWTAQTGSVGLGDLPGGDMTSLASGVSADGSVVVGSGLGEQPSDKPFRWTAETGMVGLDLALWSRRVRVSADGSSIVGTLSLPPPPNSVHAQQEGFRWSQSEGVRRIGSLSLGRLGSNAYDVSADGSVIVGSDGFQVPETAFYWHNGIGNLREELIRAGAANLDGWRLTAAWGVSADGLTVVGTGVHDGRSEGWIATLPYAVPEPSTIVLAILLVACLAAFRARVSLAATLTAASVHDLQQLLPGKKAHDRDRAESRDQ